MELKKVGVIGAGTMGICVTIDLVLHGFHVVLTDLLSEALIKAKKEIMQSIRFAPMMNKTLPKLAPEEAQRQMACTTQLASVGDCDFIIENVTERWETKVAVYQALEQYCQPGVCFGANTSCISITELGALTKRPEKVIGMHFMNPSFLKPCLEVIRGFHTSEATVETAKDLLNRLNKEAIIVQDYPGFVANRLSHLFMNEAAFVVQDQVATAKQVDDIFKKCYGHSMGPLETADLIGLDTVVHSLDVLYQSYQDSKFRCCPLLRKMVAAGRLGRKSGEGFHKYV